MLDYPEYEIIFSLQDFNDPAYKVARKIKDKYPDKDISIVVERCNAGLNPKVNNLIPAYKASKYEYILISDSNVMVEKNYLKEIIKHMDDPEVGLVSNPIKGVGGRSIGSVFENLHMNSFVMGSVCFLDKFLRMPCVVGKSMLMRRGDLEAVGGFQSVKDVLAEDYIIGKKMHKRGRKVILSNHVIKNVNEYWSIKKFLNRHTRWGKLRWKIGGIRYFSELINNAVFISFLPVFLWEPSKTTISFALLTCLIKIIGDLYLGRKTGSELNPFFYLLSPFKDIIIGLMWFIPMLSNTVVWRGNRYIIGKDSILLPSPETGMWSWRYRIADAIKARIA
ncbi:MAG: ceramide glucosyltransferase [Thermodesulfovibrionales bacterium]